MARIFSTGRTPRVAISRTLEDMRAILIRSLLQLCAALPLPVVHVLARGVGTVMSILPTRMTTTTRRNLQRCFPELNPDQLRRLTRESLQHTAMTALEMGKAWLWPMDRTLALVRAVEGDDIFQAARHGHQGTIVLAPHLGNWEVFGYHITEQATTTFLYQPPRDRSMDALLKLARGKGRAKLAATNRQGVAELLKALKNGEMVGILPDQQPPPESGRYAPFFGIPALTMTLVAKLVERTQCRVIAGFAKRLPHGQGFEVVFLDADPAVYAAELDDALMGLNRTVEACVRLAPAQYQWEYKRYKRQPDGQPFYE